MSKSTVSTCDTRMDVVREVVGRNHLIVDPRTSLLLLLVANAVALSPHSPQPLVYVLATVMSVMLLTTGRWRFARNYMITIAIFAGLSTVIFSSITHPVIVVCGIIGHYLMRFTVVFGAGAFLLLTTEPTELIAAMRRLKFPNFLLIPLAVMLRFLPAIAAEGRAIMESMKVRHIFPSNWDVIAHPIQAVEYLVVPLIVSTLRIGEDLSASALLRNLGGTKQPTSIAQLTFRPADAIVVALSVIILCAWILWDVVA